MTLENVVLEGGGAVLDSHTTLQVKGYTIPYTILCVITPLLTFLTLQVGRYRPPVRCKLCIWGVHCVLTILPARYTVCVYIWGISQEGACVKCLGITPLQGCVIRDVPGAGT